MLANNWFSADGNHYPGFDGTNPTTNDIAIFNGLNSVKNVNMQQAHEVASFQVAANYTGVITLRGQLTANGGSMANGTIIQRTAQHNGPIVIGGNFTWSGGQINRSATVTTSASTVTILPEAIVSISPPGQQGNMYLGSDLILQQDAELELRNDSTTPIMLVNRPTITMNNVSEIRIYNNAVGAGGIRVAQGDPANTIQNNGGTIRKIGGGNDYIIENPVNNTNQGAIVVQVGGLRFKNADATTGYSVTQSSGTIEVTAGSTFRADAGIGQSGGTILASGAVNHSIYGNINMSGGSIEVASTQGRLDHFGDLTITAGTVQTSYENVGGGRGGLIRSWGNTGIRITPVATTVSVNFVGGANPNQFNVMRAMRGNIDNVAAPQNNPNGYNASLVHIIRANDTYHLTRQNNQGMGALGGLLWEDTDGDGIRTENEDIYFANVLVTIYDSNDNFVDSTYTDDTGYYEFSEIAAGDYYLVFDDPPAGYVFTDQDQGADDNVDSDVDAFGKTGLFTILAGGFIDDIDAGLFYPLPPP